MTVPVLIRLTPHTPPRMRHSSPSSTKTSPFEMSTSSQEPNRSTRACCEAVGQAVHYPPEDDLGKIILPVSHLCKLQQEQQEKQQCTTLNPSRWQEIVRKDQNPSLSPTSAIKRFTKNSKCAKQPTVPQSKVKNLLSDNRWKSHCDSHDSHQSIFSPPQTPRHNQRWGLEQQTIRIREMLVLHREQGTFDEIPTPPRRQESNPCLPFFKR
ncbi:hypothetical protein IV203_011482 [Nitzschia inconspicua]|uniref:Uncharacterized protein n=1 Tax=Nitzschia inconspicua TaxID=303405 RepID=A0A9K3KTE4_9STRA|nr:hypothetical protein IV203_011482 [Nitzschia inconspicua]